MRPIDINCNGREKFHLFSLGSFYATWPRAVADGTSSDGETFPRNFIELFLIHGDLCAVQYLMMFASTLSHSYWNDCLWTPIVGQMRKGSANIWPFHCDSQDEMSIFHRLRVNEAFVIALDPVAVVHARRTIYKRRRWKRSITDKHKIQSNKRRAELTHSVLTNLLNSTNAFLLLLPPLDFFSFSSRASIASSVKIEISFVSFRNALDASKWKKKVWKRPRGSYGYISISLKLINDSK